MMTLENLGLLLFKSDYPACPTQSPYRACLFVLQTKEIKALPKDCVCTPKIPEAALIPGSQHTSKTLWAN